MTEEKINPDCKCETICKYRHSLCPGPARACGQRRFGYDGDGKHMSAKFHCGSRSFWDYKQEAYMTIYSDLCSPKLKAKNA